MAMLHQPNTEMKKNIMIITFLCAAATTMQCHCRVLLLRMVLAYHDFFLRLLLASEQARRGHEFHFLDHDRFSRIWARKWIHDLPRRYFSRSASPSTRTRMTYAMQKYHTRLNVNALQIFSTWERKLVMRIYLEKKFCNAWVRYFCTGYDKILYDEYPQWYRMSDYALQIECLGLENWNLYCLSCVPQNQKPALCDFAWHRELLFDPLLCHVK